MLKNITNNNNFIVYDIYNTTGDLTEYFFVCQNSGDEKTINNFIILDIFNSHFLMKIDEQLKLNKELRISSEELTTSVWTSTCETLNINHAFIDIFKNNVMHLNKELSEVTEEDILELNFIAYGPLYIKNKENSINENDSFIVYRNSNDNRLDYINRESFSSLIHEKTLKLKEKNQLEGKSKKMVELNKEAMKEVCTENNIEYLENKEVECNHEFKFIKRVKSEDLFLGEGVFYYAFECSHCKETKYVLNSDILDYVHNTSMEFLKLELSAPRQVRAFSFQIFGLSIDNFLSIENIYETFKVALSEDYSFPKLSKEPVLISEDDLINSNITFTNTIVEKSGLFSSKIVKDVCFTICKNEAGLTFEQNSILVNAI